MKLALLCAHYLPAWGYIEVHLSEAFARLGHEVTVITSTAVPPYLQKHRGELGAAPRGVRVLRLKPGWQLGQMMHAPGLTELVHKVKPELVVIVGLGKFFPAAAYRLPYPTLTLLGDNTHSYTGAGWKRWLYHILKAPVYRKALRKGDPLVAYTPESFTAAAQLLSGKDAAAMRNQQLYSSLGFWPEDFYFDADYRQAIRAREGLAAETLVLITATRLVAEKHMDRALSWVKGLQRPFVWIVAGSLNDSYSAIFERELQSNLPQHCYRILPLLSKPALLEWYHAADLALYTTPAISMFEAGGCGLALVLPDSPAVAHLARAEGASVWKPHATAAAQALPPFDDETRSQRARLFAATYAWPDIARELLAKAQLPPKK